MTKRKDLAPTAYFQLGIVVLNRTAVDLLTQDGENYVAITATESEFHLTPMTSPVPIRPITDARDGRKTVHLTKRFEKFNRSRFPAVWNDAKGRMEILIKQPLPARKRRNATAGAVE